MLKTIKNNLDMSLVEYVEFQLRLILGSSVINYSKGELQVLSRLYLNKYLKDSIDVILKDKIRTNKKSIDNDIRKFKKDEILDIIEDKIEFNNAFVILTEEANFSLKINIV